MWEKLPAPIPKKMPVDLALTGPTEEGGATGPPRLASDSSAVRLPEFPWPPPMYHGLESLDPKPLGTDGSLLRDVHEILRQELNRTGFAETRVYQVGAYPRANASNSLQVR